MLSILKNSPKKACTTPFHDLFRKSKFSLVSDAPRLADNLEETLKMLEEDKVIVDALGPEFVEWLVNTV